MTNLLYYVNSQFGIGHFQRSSCILERLETLYPSINITILYGGLRCIQFEKLKRSKLIKLPGFIFNGNKDTISHTPRPLNTSYTVDHILDKRLAVIKKALHNLHFDILVVEYFPFSKQFLSKEIEYIISFFKTSYRKNPIIVVSVRDFVTIDGGFDRKVAHAFLDKYCDHIMVHSDPRYARLEDSYGDISPFAKKLYYTGLVVDPTLPQPQQIRQNLLTVSVGGSGKDGKHLLFLFCEALEKLSPDERSKLDIKIFLGLFCHHTKMRIINRIKNIYRVRTEFMPFEKYRSTMLETQSSISMCGYNTAYELVASRINNIIFIPRNRTEQLMRAHMLENVGIASISSNASDLARKISRINHITKQITRKMPSLDFNGAYESAKFLSRLLK